MSVVRICALLARTGSLRYLTGANEWKQLTGGRAEIVRFDRAVARGYLLRRTPVGHTLTLEQLWEEAELNR